MTNRNTIKIYVNRIEGSIEPPSVRYVNLSSCPKDRLNALLNRIPNYRQTAVFAPLLREPLCDDMLLQNKHKHSKKVVTVIFDEDFAFQDLFILGLKEMCNYYVNARIIIQKPTQNQTVSGRTGATKNMCNPHHTVEMKQALGATSSSVDTKLNLAYVTVIKTNKCWLHSVAGLEMALKMCQIPYIEQQVDCIMPKSILQFRYTELASKYTIDANVPQQLRRSVLPSNWREIAGYTTMVATPHGLKEIEPIEDADAKETYIMQLIKKISSMALYIMNTVEMIFITLWDALKNMFWQQEKAPKQKCKPKLQKNKKK